MSTAPRTSYMSTETIPLPWCPGCGHGVIVKALDKALVKLQFDPRDVVIVTDIGCIGLADRNFQTNAFHGLHGRSITYACGLKLARPDLHVVTLIGDGACGIGGTHLLNVARRNIGITLLVANNFNYGMTGGQHSVTTPCLGSTTTTPWGNIERPMDLCATAKAAGAGWVYRATVFDRDLADVFVTAIQQPGFAMIDVWELCVAYYSQRNEMKKTQLFTMLEDNGLRVGQVADSPRPEYSARYREAFDAAKGKMSKPEKIEPAYENRVKRQTGIIIAGGAGQKVKSAATLFGQASIAAGLCATQKDDYPITVMTGHSLAEVIVSPEEVAYTGIHTPDYFVLVSEDGLKKTRARIAALPETCTVYADNALDLPDTKARVRRLPFVAVAKQVGKLSIGIIALAAMIEDAGLFDTEAFASTIRRFQKPAIAEINLRALAAGRELPRATATDQS